MAKRIKEPKPLDPGDDAGAKARRKFRFRIWNDFAGLFEGELFGESAEDVRAQLIAQLTGGITVTEAT